MTTEIQLPNSDGVLMPGMYAQVQIVNRRSNPPLLIPGDSLITGATGLQVALAQGPRPARLSGGKWTVHLQPVQVGRDYGAQTEVTSGLLGGEFVIVNPSDVVREGAEVAAQMAPPINKK
jgi:multidrug efflux pump subunit AcrA (membrane-fusion protein)